VPGNVSSASLLSVRSRVLKSLLSKKGAESAEARGLMRVRSVLALGVFSAKGAMAVDWLRSVPSAVVQDCFRVGSVLDSWFIVVSRAPTVRSKACRSVLHVSVRAGKNDAQNHRV
jgi:hypothetical protein